MIKIFVNNVLKLMNLQLVKTSSLEHQSNGRDYISAKNTVKAARDSNLTVCDYVEKLWNQAGETQKTIDTLESLNVFEKTITTVCEIGAGTGRYMEKIIDICQPRQYESYETAPDWSKWLSENYDIISRNCDGHSCQDTADDSIDLVHAHGVFVYLPFLDSFRYFIEFNRIAKKDAIIVFDCITEDCLDNKSLNKWLKSDHNYPQIMPEKYVFDFFPKEKYTQLGTFFTAYGQGKSKYFVFKKLS